MSAPDEHDHDHDHGHHEDGSPLNYTDDSRHDFSETDHYPLLVEAIRQLLIEKEIVKARDIQERLDFMDSRGVEHFHDNGAVPALGLGPVHRLIRHRDELGFAFRGVRVDAGHAAGRTGRNS